MTANALDLAAFGFSGYCAAFAVYHLSFFMFRPAGRENLWLGLLAAVMSVVILLYSPQVWDGIAWVEPLRVWVLVQPLAALAGISFARSALTFEFTRLERATVRVALIAVPIAIVVPGTLLSAMHMGTDILVLLVILVFTRRLLSLRKGPAGNLVFGGMSLFLASVLGDLAASWAGLDPLELIPGLPYLIWFGFFALLTSMSVATAVRWATAETAATVDPLTGLSRRHVFEAALEREIGRIDRTDGAAAVALMDLDGFKALNDGAGHLAGDAVLRQVGSILRRSIRETDVSARLGGDEFALLLVDTDLRGAAVVGERVRRRIEEMPVDPHDAPRVSCSLGVTRVRPDQSISQIMEAADRALYRAKSQGRNRVCIAGE